MRPSLQFILAGLVLGFLMGLGLGVYLQGTAVKEGCLKYLGEQLHIKVPTKSMGCSLIRAKEASNPRSQALYASVLDDLIEDRFGYTPDGDRALKGRSARCAAVDAAVHKAYKKHMEKPFTFTGAKTAASLLANVWYFEYIGCR